MHTKALPPRNDSDTRFGHSYFTARPLRRVAGGLVIGLLGALLMAAQCAPPPDTEDPDEQPEPASNKVTLITNLGRIIIEIFPEQAPDAVAQFRELCKDETYYNGMIFHEANPNYLIAGAYDVGLQDGEDVVFVNNSNNGLKNIRGRVALYGPTDQVSGKPQFLINLAPNPEIDFVLNGAQRPPYTVIGRVVQGMDIADNIALLETVPGESSQGIPLPNIPQTAAGQKVRILTVADGEADEPENTPPVANAGEEQTVDPSADVFLDGSDSTDPDGDPISFEWSLDSDSRDELEARDLEILLDGSSTAKPTFTAPTPSTPLDVTFVLRVTDDRGATGTDTVTIHISDNIRPIANAGTDQTAHPGDVVHLDGTGSSDPDSESALTYAWSITAESEQLLTAYGFSVPAPASAARYSFTAPDVTVPMLLTFRLEVTDVKGGQDTDTVDVQILPIAFNTAVSYAIGGGTAAIAAGDLDGDSRPDIVVVKSLTDEVAVLFNDGQGVLLDPVLYPVGSSPESVVVADFNQDGSLDIAVATRNDSKLWVLMNNGDGTFTTGEPFDTGTGPVSLVVADIDGESGPDLAAVNTPASNSLTILTNDGLGGFRAGARNLSITGLDESSEPITPVGGRVVAAGNIDPDGLGDLAVAYADRKVFVLLGDAEQLEHLRFEYHLEAGEGLGATDPRAILLTDLSGNAQPDLVVALHGQNMIALRKNNGSGLFGFEALYGTGAGPSALAGADLDGDGDLDLAVANESANTVSVFQNQGTASFREAVDLPLTHEDIGPVGLVSADLNGDEANDLVVVNKVSGTVSVLLNLTVTADAGEDQNVLVGEPVQLQGVGRSREGATFSYTWTQSAGPTVELSDPRTPDPTFTAPAESGQLIFRLTAVDDQGAAATDSVIVDVYVQTDSGLKYCNVVRGDGPVVQPTSTVEVLYTGRFNDRSGSTFDSTAPENEPREFSLEGLIAGWQEGLGQYDMRVGGTRLLIIPPELGYGTPSSSPNIPDGATLWFEIEVLDAF